MCAGFLAARLCVLSWFPTLCPGESPRKLLKNQDPALLQNSGPERLGGLSPLGQNIRNLLIWNQAFAFCVIVAPSAHTVQGEALIIPSKPNAEESLSQDEVQRLGGGWGVTGSVLPAVTSHLSTNQAALLAFLRNAKLLLLS